MRLSQNMWSENKNNLVVEGNERPEMLPRSLTEFTFHFTVFRRIWDRKYCALIFSALANCTPVEFCPLQCHRFQVISFHFQ